MRIKYQCFYAFYLFIIFLIAKRDFAAQVFPASATVRILPPDKFKVGEDLVPRMVSLWQRQPKEVQDNNNLKLGRFGTYATYMAGNFGKNYDVLESNLLLTTKQIAITTGIKTYPMSGTGTVNSANGYTDKVVNYAFFDAVAFQVLGEVKGAFAGVMTPNTKELVIPAFLVHWIVAHQQAKQTAQNIITTYNLASVVVPALRAGAALRVFMLTETALGVVVDNPSANFTSYLTANPDLKTAFEGVVDIFRLAQLANGSFSTAKIKILSDIWGNYASLNGVAQTEYKAIEEFLRKTESSPDVYEADTDGYIHIFANATEKANVKNWLKGINDNRLYIVIHGQGSKLFMLKSAVSTTGQDTEVEMTTRSLARLIKNITSSIGKEIVLLSCASEQAAQNLVNKLGGIYTVVAWTGAVKVFDNGFIQGQGACKRYSPASSNSISAIVLSGTDVPKGKATTITSNFVLLATAANSCTAFNDVKTAAERVKTTTFTDAKIDEAINKLCVKINNTTICNALNTQLISYSDLEIKAFLEQITATSSNDRHISKHINSNFGIEQLKAWKKLYTSGFETDFEYIRTLVYVGVNACTVTITPNTTKSVTVVHGTFTTTFINDDINATGGTLASGLNKILNIHPLIANADYIVESRYKYETDNIGRVVKVTTVIGASLANPPSARVKGSDFSPSEHARCHTLKGGNPGTTDNNDDAGHLIAAQLNGVPEQINVLPQIRKQNQSRTAVGLGLWRAMELEWKATLSTQTVTVEIVPIFLGTNRRPESYDVKYWYGTILQTPQNITNKP